MTNNNYCKMLMISNLKYEKKYYAELFITSNVF